MKNTFIITALLAFLATEVNAWQTDTSTLDEPQISSTQPGPKTLPVQKQEAMQTDTVALLISHYEYQEALSLLDQLDPARKQTELLYLRGIALKGLSRFEEAADCLGKVFATDTTQRTYGIELARCLDAMNDHAVAQQVLLSLRQLYADDVFLLQQLAQSFYQAEVYGKAKTYYQEIYRTDSSYYFTKQLANCYDLLNMRDSAILYFGKVLLLHPEDAYAVFRIGTLYKDTRRYQAGLQVTEDFLETDTTDLNINLLNGYLHYLRSDFRTAAQRFQRCENMNDTSLFVNKYLGNSLFKLNDYNRAIYYLDRASKQDSMDVEINWVLGLACQYAERPKEGINYLQKAIALLKPAVNNLTPVYTELARTYTLDFQYEKALDTYLEALEADPHDTLLLYMIGSHYENWIGDKAKALEYYHEFMATRPAGSSGSRPEVSPAGLVLSYYDVVEVRIQTLEKEIRQRDMERQVLPFFMIRAEIDTLLKVLDTTHPTFSKSASRRKLLDIRDTIRTELNLHEYFKLLQPLVSVDGHTTLQFTGRIYPELDNPYFPFELVAYHDNLYIKNNLSTDGFVEPGARIVSLNGQDPADIIPVLLPYMPGELTKKKLRALEGNGFANFYRLAFGNFEHFDLLLEQSGNRYRVSVPGMERSAFETAATDPLNFKILDDSIAYFKVGRFINPTQFMQYTDSIFAVLKQLNIPNLIIDKTQGGGFGDLADSLLSYFSTTPYRSYEKKMVRISPETADYIIENQSLGKNDGDYFVLTPELKAPVQRENHYYGKVYILTGPTAYSAATLFVAMAKCYSDAIIIGEETGQPLVSNGDLSRYDLRFSGFSLYTSLSTYYMPCYQNEREGVKPDIEVTMTLEDLLEGKNRYLDETLKMIRESSSLLGAQR